MAKKKEGDEVAKKDEDTKVKTAYGDEKLVTRKVRVLSFPWTTYEPSPLQEGQFVAAEHRATRGEVVEIPESAAQFGEREDINAFFNDEEVVEDSDDVEAGDEVTPISQMSTAELVNWHRATKPSVDEVVKASGGDGDLARRLLEAENAASGGDPRDGVVKGLAEVVARSNV